MRGKHGIADAPLATIRMFSIHALLTTRFNAASERSALRPERSGAQAFVLFLNTRG